MRLTAKAPLTEESILSQLKEGNITFFNGDASLSNIHVVRRGYLQTRIRAMDFASAVNRTIKKLGFTVPRRLRKLLARVFEG